MLAASFWLTRFSASFCITSNRLISFVLIFSNSSTFLSFPRHLRRGHSNFGKRGLYHFGLTLIFAPVDKLQVPNTTKLGKILAAGDDMAIQDSNIKAPDLLARKEIPDAWAKSGHC